MLEILREGSTLYKWGVRKMANLMGSIKNTIVVYFSEL
jgi:hypothetical protein